jgi:hypothetical protein
VAAILTLAVAIGANTAVVQRGGCGRPAAAAIDGPDRLSFLTLFELLGVPPLLGRAFAGAGDEHQVVLGHALGQRRFGGDQAIVGQSLVLDGRSVNVEALHQPIVGRARPAPLVLAGAARRPEVGRAARVPTAIESVV